MKIWHNVDVKNYTTFRVSALVKKLIFIENENELLEVFQQLPERFLVLGKGSNMLFVEDYEGVVVRLDMKSYDINESAEEHVLVTVEAGMVWDDWVLVTINHGWFGLENLSGIPGSVGASPVQNIGAYGVEVAEFIHRVKVFDVEHRRFFWLPATACNFGYRRSIFHEKPAWIVTAVEFKLPKRFHPRLSYHALKNHLLSKNILFPSAVEVREAILEIRNSKLPDPRLIGNAGSFFKNPIIDRALYEKLIKKYPDFPAYPVGEGKIKTHAAWLIDQTGLKGFSLGDAAVHDHQPLVLVNRGNASGQDIFTLSTFVQQKVFEKFSIWLEPEVHIIRN